MEHCEVTERERVKCGEIILLKTNKWKLIYSCAFCLSEYRNLKELLRHMRQHTSLKEGNIKAIFDKQREEKKTVKVESTHDLEQSDEEANYEIELLEEESDLYDIEEEKPKFYETGEENIEKTIAISERNFQCDVTELLDTKPEIDYEIKKEIVYDDSSDNAAENEFETEYEAMSAVDEDLEMDECHLKGDSIKIELLDIDEFKDDLNEEIEPVRKVRHYIRTLPWRRTEVGIQHLKLNESTYSRPHKCDYCDAAFKDSSNLRVHRFRHLGIKPHSCTECKKKFTSSTELKLHMRMHTGERPYVCQECGQTFKNSAHLCAHRRRHSNTRPYTCEICGKSYFDSKSLRDHNAVHSTERPFQCKTCQATFTRRKALVEHEKLHSDIKRYICKVCDKAFAQNAGLHSHMKHQHGYQRS